MEVKAYTTALIHSAMPEWNDDTGLAALFAAAFVSATLLPANSEIVLLAVLDAFPERFVEAIAVATVGNTLGGLTTYGIGRLAPGRKGPDARAIAWMRRHGAWVLLLSWLPIIGDALCAAAGWLRVGVAPALAAMAAGKLARYLAVALLAKAIVSD
jgi:membrane protein YqaA with SNARE-associated domain